MSELSLNEIVDRLAWYQKYFKLNDYVPYEYQKKLHHAYGYKTEELATDRAVIAANKIGKCDLITQQVDTTTGPHKIGDIFGTECDVLAWDGEKKVPRRVLAWVQKPPQDCYRFTMSDGRRVECSAGHQLLTLFGWRAVSEFLPSPLESNSDDDLPVHLQGVLRCFHKLQGWIHGCSMDFRQCGGKLLYDQADAQVFLPSLDGVPLYTRLFWRLGALAYRGIGILSDTLRRLSSCDAGLRHARLSVEWLGRVFCSVGLPYPHCTQTSQQFSIAALSEPQQVLEVLPRQSQCFSLSDILCVDDNHIVSVKYIGKHHVYDLQVEELENYCAAGLVHHNTYCCAMEVAIHATGLYPDWWMGHRWKHRLEILCGSESNELTRDVMQRELFGDPEDKDSVGTGSVPKEYIGRITRKAGVPNAIDSVLIKSVFGGWSRIFFRAYEQGAKKHQGFHIHIGWLDEEPPRDIKSQYKRATLNTHGILLHSFTPESGMTEVCNEYFNDRRIGQSLVQATWDDCPLFDDDEYRAMVLDQFPAHEREMRSKGVPQMGSGLVFTIPDEEIMHDAFEIPAHWPRLKGVDFGVDHPFAAVALAFDMDSGTVYLYWCHRKTRQTIADNAAAINSFDVWMPVIWPHDGMVQDKHSGKPLADIYREPPYNVNMRNECFSNPAPPGKREGQGGQGVEVGLLALEEAMKDGKFKVFSHLSDWFEEKRTYHRKDGQIVKERDDLMAATRYAFQSARFAEREVVHVRRRTQHKGMRNW